MTKKQPVICIVGPSASGKSELAQRLAERIDGEVISADSMQIYKGMDIGTGKLLPDQRRVVHYGLDLIDLDKSYSTALYQDYARRAVASIEEKGKYTILCGGTGLYIRSVVDDYNFPKGEQTNNAIRDTYSAYADKHGNEALWQLLEERDPESAKLIAPGDTKRVVRAFELLDQGVRYADTRRALAHIPEYFTSCWIGLSVEKEILNKRIDTRVDEMFASGLVDEVRGLLDRGLRDNITACQAIGYKEVLCFIDGEISLDETKEMVKVATKRYAKRQRTWFRKEKRISWIDANRLDYETMLQESLDLIDKFRLAL